MRAKQVASCTSRCVAKIDVEIFDLGGPVIGKGPIQARARSPAGLGVAGGDAVEIRLDIGEGAAGCRIEQRAIRRITNAAASRRQPIVAGLALAAERTDTGSGAGIDAGIIPMALDAKDKGAGLEIHAERAADNAAIIVGCAACSWKAANGVAVHLALPRPQPPLMPT